MSKQSILKQENGVFHHTLFFNTEQFAPQLGGMVIMRQNKFLRDFRPIEFYMVVDDIIVYGN